jgi:hypothetical protein
VQGNAGRSYGAKGPRDAVELRETRGDAVSLSLYGDSRTQGWGDTS